MPTCVYCRQTDPSHGFNREHVVPYAFAKGFGGALVLTGTVCTDCNQYFGDTFDRLLGRDSIEALLRLDHGLKDPSELAGMFEERVHVRLPMDGSEWGGTHLRLVAPPPGARGPFVDVVPQVGFERRDGQGWEYFTEDDLRDRADELREFVARECGPRRKVLYDSEDGKARLRALVAEKGFRIREIEDTAGFPPFASGNIRAEVQYRMDQIIARAAAKIGFNYLVHSAGTAFALDEEFDPVRGFVRYDMGIPPTFVRPQATPMLEDRRGGAPPRCHVLTVFWDGRRRDVLARLTLFNNHSYLVRLCQYYRGVWREIISGHTYDLDTREVRGLTHTHLVAPWEP